LYCSWSCCITGVNDVAWPAGWEACDSTSRREVHTRATSDNENTGLEIRPDEVEHGDKGEWEMCCIVVCV